MASNIVRFCFCLVLLMSTCWRSESRVLLHRTLPASRGSSSAGSARGETAAGTGSPTVYELHRISPGGPDPMHHFSLLC